MEQKLHQVVGDQQHQAQSVEAGQTAHREGKPWKRVKEKVSHKRALNTITCNMYFMPHNYTIQVHLKSVKDIDKAVSLI